MKNNNDFLRFSINQLKNFDYPNKVIEKKFLTKDIELCNPEEIDITLAPYNYTNAKYNQIDTSFIHLQVGLCQDYDSMGFYYSEDFIESFEKSDTDIYTTRPRGKNFSYYETTGTTTVTGFTEEQLSEVRSYNRLVPYQRNLNLSEDPSTSFTGVLDLFSNKVEYVINGDVTTGGVYVEGTGVKYLTDLITNETIFSYQVKGIVETNFSLSAIYSKDDVFGLIEPPTVSSDINVNREQFSVFEAHLRLNDLQTIDDLEKNNFYIIR